MIDGDPERLAGDGDLPGEEGSWVGRVDTTNEGGMCSQRRKVGGQGCSWRERGELGTSWLPGRRLNDQSAITVWYLGRKLRRWK